MFAGLNMDFKLSFLGDFFTSDFKGSVKKRAKISNNLILAHMLEFDGISYIIILIPLTKKYTKYCHLTVTLIMDIV